METVATKLDAWRGGSLRLAVVYGALCCRSVAFGTLDAMRCRMSAYQNRGVSPVLIIVASIVMVHGELRCRLAAM